MRRLEVFRGGVLPCEAQIILDLRIKQALESHDAKYHTKRDRHGEHLEPEEETPMINVAVKEKEIEMQALYTLCRLLKSLLEQALYFVP